MAYFEPVYVDLDGDFDKDPKDTTGSGLRGAQAGTKGIRLVIPSPTQIPLALLSDDRAYLIEFRSAKGFDRLQLCVNKLDQYEAGTIPPGVRIRWQLLVGGYCLVDRSKPVSGPDTSAFPLPIQIAQRRGILYHFGGMLVHSAALCAVIPDASPRISAMLTFSADCRGGTSVLSGASGLPPVYKGGVIG